MGHGASTTQWPSFLAQSGAMVARDLWQVGLPSPVALSPGYQMNTDALPVFGRPWGYLCVDWMYGRSVLLLKHGCLSTHSRQFAFPTDTCVLFPWGCRPLGEPGWENARPAFESHRSMGMADLCL